MARWQGTWLTGLGSAGVGQQGPGHWRGQRLGLPEDGPGSVASFGAKAGAFIIDVLLAGLVGSLVNTVVTDPTDVQRNAAGYVAFAVLYVGSLVLTAQTPGMRLVGLRVLPLPGGRATVGLVPALLRTAVLATLLPALVSDGDARGLHDKAAGTVVVRC